VISGFQRDINEICSFWDFTQHRMVDLYRCFGSSYWSNF